MRTAQKTTSARRRLRELGMESARRTAERERGAPAPENSDSPFDSTDDDKPQDRRALAARPKLSAAPSCRSGCWRRPFPTSPSHMPTLLSNAMPDATEQTIDESLHGYAALLRLYDRRLHDPDSLVLSLMAGMVARLIDMQQSKFERADYTTDHPLPVVREIVRAAEAGELTLSAEARAFLRPLILMGAKQLPALMSTTFALAELKGRALKPGGVASRYERWLQEEPVNPAVAAIVACRFAEDRMPRHPYPLLVEANADLRRPLEHYLTDRGIVGPNGAALLGAKALCPTLVDMFWSIACDYEEADATV